MSPGGPYGQRSVCHVDRFARRSHRLVEAQLPRGLWFLAWLIGGIGEQVNKAAVAVEADNTVEVMTAIGVGGLYLLIAGGIISLMGSLISGPNPLAVALNKALDKLKGAE